MPAPPILEIYVVWHPDDELGRSVADALVRHFHSPAYSGLAGGAVEVYLRSAPWKKEGGPPRPLPFMSALPAELPEAQITAVIPVMGRSLARAVQNDASWRDFVEAIFASDADRAGHGTQWVAAFPLRVPGAELSGSLLAELASGPQALPADAATSEATLSREVAQAIAQRLARESTGSELEERITVFISHTKHPDSGPRSPAGLVQLVREVLHDTRLDVFFDAHDIQVGSDWVAELDQNASRHALLMIRTDAYASRDWTQREVLAAKTHDVPIVSLYTLRDEEARGSFLMDHVPVVACPPGAERASIERALNRLVDEALKRALWFSQRVYLARDGFDWLPVHAPEPVTLTAWLKRHRLEGDPHLLIMHPDPPLGSRERDVVLELCEIAGLDGAMDIVTPRTFAARGGEVERACDPVLVSSVALSGAAVAISVSDSIDLPRLGLTQAHCELAVAELARAIFIAGGTIVYGGRLVPAGFTDILLDEARRYRGDRDALVLCVPESEHRKLSDDELRRRASEMHTSAELVLLDAGGAPVGIGDRGSPGATSDPASALSAMRQHVTNRTTARVLVGGRLRGHQGAAPGVLEEAQMSVRASQPLYVAGGFGGAAAALGRVLGCDDGAWFPNGYPEGADDHSQLLRQLGSESEGVDRISPGLNSSERAQLAASHRPGDIASLVVRGLGAYLA